MELRPTRPLELFAADDDQDAAATDPDCPSTVFLAGPGRLRGLNFPACPGFFFGGIRWLGRRCRWGRLVVRVVEIPVLCGLDLFPSQTMLVA